MLQSRVLVVEDEEPVARALERWLKRQGAVVRVLFDPVALEEVLVDFVPTHLVSDLNMPERDGLEVLAVTKRLMPNVVRCLLSGSLDTLKPERLEPLQPVFLVPKPWHEASLAAGLGLVQS